MAISDKRFEELHGKVDNNSEALARIEGKLDAKQENWTAVGVFIALVAAIGSYFR